MLRATLAREVAFSHPKICLFNPVGLAGGVSSSTRAGGNVPEEITEECGAAQGGVRCSLEVGHEGRHGYGGYSWDRSDEELEPESDVDPDDPMPELRKLITVAVSEGVLQALRAHDAEKAHVTP